ncbi:MAG: hypothetical protein AAF974_01970 [Cyanobacteria bacterium P01_E01_bin.34]
MACLRQSIFLMLAIAVWLGHYGKAGYGSIFPSCTPPTEEFAMFTVARASLLCALLCAPMLFHVQPSLAQLTSDVQFQPGSDSANLNGTISGPEYFDYVLRANGGQVMSVSLTVDATNGNGTAYFNILPPGSDGEAIFNGSMSADRYGEVNLPQDGDYTIRVYLMGNDRDTDKTVGYTVSVTINDGGANSSASTSSNGFSPAESNCLAAVANETGVGDVSTIGVDSAESGTSVRVAVSGAEAPWECVVDTDGETVVNVFYTGSEGVL